MAILMLVSMGILVVGLILRANGSGDAVLEVGAPATVVSAAMLIAGLITRDEREIAAEIESFKTFASLKLKSIGNWLPWVSQPNAK